MCKELLQEYACTHKKRICLTPCDTAPHTNSPTPSLSGSTIAAESAYNVPLNSSPSSPQCPTLIRHPLSRSRYPCLACYMQPRYKALQDAWATTYQIQHPASKPEDVGGLCGIQGIPERVGLVNVVLEMENMVLRNSYDGSGSPNGGAQDRRSTGIGNGGLSPGRQHGVAIERSVSPMNGAAPSAVVSRLERRVAESMIDAADQE